MSVKCSLQEWATLGLAAAYAKQAAENYMVLGEDAGMSQPARKMRRPGTGKPEVLRYGLALSAALFAAAVPQAPE